MSLAKVKALLASIDKSTGTKHPKTLVNELCRAVQLLVVEIENLKRPKITLVSPEQVAPIDTPQIPCAPTKSPREDESVTTEKPGPIQRSRGPRRRFNAGDAQ